MGVASLIIKRRGLNKMSTDSEERFEFTLVPHYSPLQDIESSSKETIELFEKWYSEWLIMKQLIVKGVILEGEWSDAWKATPSFLTSSSSLIKKSPSQKLAKKNLISAWNFAGFLCKLSSKQRTASEYNIWSHDNHMTKRNRSWLHLSNGYHLIVSLVVTWQPRDPQILRYGGR